MASAQEINNARFSEEALSWDSNKRHGESTQKAFEAIQQYVPAFEDGRNKELDVLEIGCGTGLVSFMLAPHVRSLIGVDTADGMISAFSAKLSAIDKPNLCAVNHLLTNADSPQLQGTAALLATQRGEESAPPYRFDLVVSHLTLHHIPSLPQILATLHACLKPGGVVALTDYEDFGPEAVQFHPIRKRPGVERHGIKRDEMEELLLGTGFNEVRTEKAFVLRKEVEAEGGKPAREMDFPFLMCYGMKI
ncbi:S-adenosyl-L-methionine-dependent methyltransferase [Clathrospora elynae]|uniref:S-adenosyl-L-methionine-dependent methyltransferase n=1 Tax=Clathrospora elynae TaxID=706981 RepID=A0A6A5T6N5_9PLEO|nr:S-adenosyl-L-methionine-dependent methyltransferase [Clathrospora elynae]